MNTLRLMAIDRVAEKKQRRSVLYMVGFCALALAVDLATVSVPREELGRQSTFWLVWVLALLTGLMAIRTTRERRESVSAAPDELPGRRVFFVPGATADPPRPDQATLRGFKAWRRVRSNNFSEFDIDYLPKLADVKLPAESANKGPKKGKAKAEKKFDPWAKALEELDRRQK